MAVNTLFWNVRGIGKDPTVNRIKKLLKLHDISFIAVFEPMLAMDKIQLIARKWKFKFNFTNSQSTIWIFAKAAFTCQLLNDTSQHLRVRLQHYLWPISVNATSVYAKCDARERQELWDDIIDMGNSFFSDVPWIVGGDFNIILYPSEKKGRQWMG